MPTLCLCLIAKDEAEMLPACLASVEGVVDEMIVVDTGSTDGTPEIARQAGATVIEHPWQGDFAAARNAGLAVCRSDWVLVLDADERLAPGAGPSLKAAIAMSEFDVGMLPLHNADRLDATAAEVLSGAASFGEPTLLPRLLRRTPDLAYRGVVHETIGDLLLEGNRRVVRVDVPIIHLGAIPELRERLGKDARNLALLERRCELDPDDSVGLAYLGWERFRVGNIRGAVEAASAGWRALEAVARPAGPNPAFVSLATLWVQLQLAAGEPLPALACLEQCAAWGSTHPNLGLLEGRVRYALSIQRPNQAPRHLALGEAALSRALDQHGQLHTDWVVDGATSWNARYYRGLLRLLAGRTDEALVDLAACLAEHPDHSGALLARAEVALAEDDSEQALRELEPLLSSPGTDAWILAAQACDRMGAVADVIAFTRQANASLDAGLEAHHRAGLLAELSVAAALYQGHAPPGPGLAGRVSDLVARRPATETTATVDPAALEGLVTNLIRADRGAALAALVVPRAEEVLPGITEALADVFERLGVTVEDDGEPEFVFVGGASRSGTTLFRAMLHAHPRFHGGPVVELVTSLCQQRLSWLQALGSDLPDAGVSEELVDRSLRAFLETMLRGLGPEGVRVVENTPDNLLHMAFLARIFPQARFIHVVRDGRAVSGALVRQPEVDPVTGQPVDRCQSLANAATYWRDVVLDICDQAPAAGDRYLEVRYERLVTEPEAVMREVLAFLGERWDPAVLLPTRASSTEAPTPAGDTGAVEDWRAHLDDSEVEPVMAVAETLLGVLGYLEDPEPS